MKRHFLYIVLFLLATNAFSQGGCFTVDKPRGCAPLTIHLTNCFTGVGGSTPAYDYGNGKPVSTVDTTLSTPGTYTITQIISAGGTKTDVQTVEVLATPTPNFKIEICQGNLINVVIQDSQYDKYIIDYGDGSSKVTVNPLSSTPYTYPNSNSRTVTVQGAYLPLMCGASSSKTISPLQTLVAPDLQKLQVNVQSTNGKITLNYVAQSNQKYIVKQRLLGSGTYVNIDTISNLAGLNTYVITSLNTQSNQYGFTLTAFDDCGNTSPSAEIFSIINNVTPGNNKNDIVWNGIPTSLTNYQLIKNQNTTSPITTTTGTSYTDTPILCGEVNCYFVIADMSILNTSGKPLQSISDTLCAKGISNVIPTAVQNFNSTYSGGNIVLSWDKPSAGVQLYTLKRSDDGSGFNKLSTFNQLGYTDNSLNQTSTYCYQINYEDDCGNPSPLTANGTCAIKLTVEVNPSNIFQNLLSWTPYVGSGGSATYAIEKLNDAGQVISTTPSASLAATDLISDQSVQLVRYRIKATDASGFISYSEIIEIKYEGTIKFPTAFTPNGDGVNDTFISINKFLKEYELTIYNRWGEVVFNSKNPKEGWDGMYKGIYGLPDAYAYLVEITDLWGKQITQRGTVTLLK